jgi:hypothetical protein
MTDGTFISREVFSEQYLGLFEKLFTTNSGICGFKHIEWECLEFCEMTLPGFFDSGEVFEMFLQFISKAARPQFLIFAEVESINKFTEIRLVEANRLAINSLWTESRLPHFNTVFFDTSGKWGALFNNFEEKITVRRKVF